MNIWMLYVYRRQRRRLRFSLYCYYYLVTCDFEEWLSRGEKKRVKELDNVFEGAILALFHHHVHYLALLSSLVLGRSGVV